MLEVWPDFDTKSSPIIPRMLKKVTTVVCTRLKYDMFQSSPKYSRNICQQDRFQTAQIWSHWMLVTAPRVPVAP